MLAITTKAKHTVELQDIISYENIRFPPNNGAIHNVAEIFKVVMSSATEAEMGALYIHGRKAVEERNILEELCHPQFPTPIQTDNSTAEGMINKKVQPKHTKAMDMQFHWLRDGAVNQQQFRFYWRPGPLNYADYWTKHQPLAHHKLQRIVGAPQTSNCTLHCRGVLDSLTSPVLRKLWFGNNCGRVTENLTL
jgi:hypothetical protein